MDTWQVYLSLVPTNIKSKLIFHFYKNWFKIDLKLDFLCIEDILLIKFY